MKFNFIVIALFLLVSIGFTFMLTLSTFYQSEDSTDSKFSVLDGLLTGELKSAEEETRKIIQLLKQDENIENKFIMSSQKSFPYHTNSKLIYASFTEGSPDETVEDFIRKKSWSYYELYLSANNSIPPHKDLYVDQIPNYIIYSYTNFSDDPNTTWYKYDNTYIKILKNPEDPNIPKFLNPIYSSAFGNGGIVVYEVNLQD